MHGSWRLALCCCFFVLGVLASLSVRTHWSVGVVALGVLAGLAFIGRLWALPLLATAALAVGISYGSTHLGARDAYESYVGGYVRIQGTVREDPSNSASGNVSVQLGRVVLNDISMPGVLLVSVRSAGLAKRGDTVGLEGVLKDGFGSFPATLSVQSFSSIVRPVPGDVGRVVRDWFADAVRRVIPEPQASLGIGFLTGQKSALPEDLAEALKIAGLTHIVVASGYNLTILVQASRRIFLKVSKYLSAVFSALMITAFVAVAGLSPSMSRASLVSGLGLAAWYYGHTFHPFVLLPLAAAVTVAIQPSYVWGDMGWQLSFVAFAGVMIVAPLLQTYFFGAKQPGLLRQILGETVSAHAVTVPIIALGFGVVSNVAIIANLLVVPLVPLAMLLTFVSGILSLGAPAIAWIISVPTSWLLGYMTNVATFVSELDWAQSEVSESPWLWAAYGLALATVLLYLWKVTAYRFGSNTKEPLM